MNQAEELTAMPSAASSQPLLRPGRGMSWPAAREQAHEAGRQLSPQWLPLETACGRPLRVDLLALTDLPATDVSAMDGWAVAGPPPWRVVAELPAGRVLDRWLAEGECAGIATGAVVPDGADAVLPIEHSLRDSARVRGGPEAVLLPGTHIRRAGEEAHRGDVLLPSGTVVTPPAVGLAAAAGHDALLVTPPATVDVFILGDEIISNGLPARGLVRDALGPQLPAWLAAYGTARPSITVLPDRLPDLTAGLADSGADLVVTTGGTSVGLRDHVRAAVLSVGGRMIVDGVHVKPGHPMILAALPGGRWLVGLPGNPLAACVALETLVRPLLDVLHGHCRTPTLTARLAGAEPGRPGDGHRLLPVHRDAAAHAVVLPSCGSAMLRGLSRATGLAVVPPRGAAAGDEVEYLPLPW